MSKALVIKGADFSENKLGTIVLGDDVPCTSILLNVNTISFTEWAETYTLVPTVTPSNTTDSKIWSSSDTSVAAVSSNGVVTAKGVGTATITVRCGNYSASCAVTSIVRFSESDLFRTNEYGVIANSYAAGNDAAQFVTGGVFHVVGYGLESGILSSYEVAVNSSETVGSPVYSIPIPTNASTLKVTLPDYTGSKLRLANISYHNSTSLQTSVEGVTACKFIGNKTYTSSDFGDSGTTVTIDLATEEPSGADSICFYVQGNSGIAVTSITDPIILEFS